MILIFASSASLMYRERCVQNSIFLIMLILLQGKVDCEKGFEILSDPSQGNILKKETCPAFFTTIPDGEINSP